MAKQANPTLVGGFVVGAVGLTIAGLLAFGGHRWSGRAHKYVAFFEESVRGLDVGAPIRYMGVQIGSVSDIEAVWSVEEQVMRIPVELTIFEGKEEVPAEFAEEHAEHEAFMEHLVVERGLKAVLRWDSFITGKLFVAMTFLPDEPIQRYGHPELLEIPTSQTELDKLKRSLVELPVEELFRQTIEAIAAVEELAGDPRIDQLVSNMDKLVVGVDAQVLPLAESARGTLEEARGLMRDANGKLDRLITDMNELIVDVDAQILPLSDSARVTLEDARSLLQNTNERVDRLSTSMEATMSEGQSLVEHLNEGVAEEYLVYRLVSLIDELEGAARSVRMLADQLERRPESVLTGKSDR